MMMSGKDFLKSHVLSWRRKTYSDWEDITSCGRAFLVFGPATAKKQLSTNMRTKCQQCTIKTTQLQENYTTTERKHEIMTLQCHKLNASQKFKQI